MSDVVSSTLDARVTQPDSEDLTTSGSDGQAQPVRRYRRRGSRSSPSKKSAAHHNGATNHYLQVPKDPRIRSWDRSPSPLGLIPIHTRFRSFIHRHEIPRKALHVSIGFLTLSLYAQGFQSYQIHPVLLSALIPVTAVDILRHNFPSLNKVYVQAMGALMRESEVDGYNGVIWYLAGTWAVLRFFPKDIGTMGILLLSWCDTAASTFGRLWGRHTWQVRKGKSFAGSAAALLVGGLTAWMFWGWAAPRYGAPNGWDLPPYSFAFQGTLSLPTVVRETLGLSEESSTIRGAAALGLISLWSGVVASVSEAIDLFGWDDNFSIPVLCGVGLWGFLKLFGHS